MAESSAKLSRQEQLKVEMQSKLGKGPQARTRKQEATSEGAQDAKFADIKSNPYHAVFFSAEMMPEQKKAEIIKLQTHQGTKAENAANVAAFIEFKEYLQYKRQEMAKAFMKLASTSDFAELQAIQEQMNRDILDFEKKMEPLTSMLEALYTLRTNGDNLIYEAFKEIEQEKEDAIKREEALKAEERNVEVIESTVRKNKRRIVELQSQKRFGFFGGPPAKAMADIAELDESNGHLANDVISANEKIQQLRASAANESTLPPELLESKEKLKELLNLSSQEHVDRQQALQSAAIQFVESSQERSAPVLNALEGLDTRVGQIYEANGQLRGIYAIMDDASKEVTEINGQKRDTIVGQLGNSDLSSMRKIELEDEKGAIDEHIGQLEMTYKNTTTDLVKLSEQRGRIQTARTNNQQQISKTRDLMSSGIGGVADQLVTVLNGISQAALQESSETLGDSISLMDKKTRAVSEKGAMSRVFAQAEENSRLVSALDEFRSYGDTIKVSTSMFKEQMQETMALQKDFKALGDDIKGAVDESAAAIADAREEHESGESGATADTSETTPQHPKNDDDPFNFG